MSGSSPVEQWSRKLPWVPAVLAVAAALIACVPRYQRPVDGLARAPTTATSVTPVRQPNPHALYTIGRFTYQCGECHRTGPEPYTAGAEMTKHMGFHLSHGINSRCLNCHHPANREAFVDAYGEEIPWSEPEKLCSKCHGPVYRDWQHGSHGRSNGYWDTAQGPLIRLKCTECHNPHHPPFQPIASAPPPRMLRGAPPHASEHSGARNPLRLHNNTQNNNDHTAATGEGHE